jgi:hypothetical protein
MSAKSRTEQVTRELRDRGLRKGYARAVAKAARHRSGGRDASPELRAFAEELRALAADVELLGVGEHAEPQASARRAAHPVAVDGAGTAAATPSLHVRRRVRRN